MSSEASLLLAGLLTQNLTVVLSLEKSLEKGNFKRLQSEDVVCLCQHTLKNVLVRGA